MKGGAILAYLYEIKLLIGFTSAIVLAYAEQRFRIQQMKKDHTAMQKEIEAMQEELVKKADVSVCRIVHTEQKESTQVVLSTLDAGISNIREDIKNISFRLDQHIQFNGGR